MTPAHRGLGEREGRLGIAADHDRRRGEREGQPGQRPRPHEEPDLAGAGRARGGGRLRERCRGRGGRLRQRGHRRRLRVARRLRRGGSGIAARGRRAPGSLEPSRAGLRRTGLRGAEGEVGVPDVDHVAVLEQVRVGDGSAVHLGPVPAPEISEVQAPVKLGELRVCLGDRRIVEGDLGRGSPPSEICEPRSSNRRPAPSSAPNEIGVAGAGTSSDSGARTGPRPRDRRRRAA